MMVCYEMTTIITTNVCRVRVPWTAWRDPLSGILYILSNVTQVYVEEVFN